MNEMAILDVFAPSVMGAAASSEASPEGEFAQALEGALAAASVPGTGKVFDEGGTLLEAFLKQLAEQGVMTPQARAVAFENMAAAGLPPGLVNALARAVEKSAAAQGAGETAEATDSGDRKGLRALIELLAALLAQTNVTGQQTLEPADALPRGLPHLAQELVARLEELAGTAAASEGMQPAEAAPGQGETAVPAGEVVGEFAPVLQEIVDSAQLAAPIADGAPAEAEVPEEAAVAEKADAETQPAVTKEAAAAQAQRQSEAAVNDTEVNRALQEARVFVHRERRVGVKDAPMPVEDTGQGTRLVKGQVQEPVRATNETQAAVNAGAASPSGEPAAEGIARQTAEPIEVRTLEAGGKAAALLEQSATQAGRAADRPEAGPRIAGANQERMIARIAGAMSQASASGRTTVRLRLYPPELGTVRIQVSSVRGVVSARMETSTAEARQVLSANLSALRETIRGTGVNLRDMEVSHRNPSAQLNLTGERGGGTWQFRQQWQGHGSRSEGQAVEAGVTWESSTALGVLDLLV